MRSKISGLGESHTFPIQPDLAGWVPSYRYEYMVSILKLEWMVCGLRMSNGAKTKLPRRGFCGAVPQRCGRTVSQKRWVEGSACVDLSRIWGVAVSGSTACNFEKTHGNHVKYIRRRNTANRDRVGGEANGLLPCKRASAGG